MDWTKKRTGWAAVLVSVVTGVCALAVTARDNLPEGQVHEAAEKVCTACELAGVLQPDGGVVRPGGNADRRPALVREGTGLRPVLLPAGSAQQSGKATVEELHEDSAMRGGEAPDTFR